MRTKQNHAWELTDLDNLSISQRAQISPSSIIRALHRCSICSMIRARISQGPRSIFVFIDEIGSVFIGTRPVPLCGAQISSARDPSHTSSGHVWASPVYSSGTSASSHTRGSKPRSSAALTAPAMAPAMASVTHICARCGMRKVLSWGAGERRGAVLVYYRSDGSQALEWRAHGRVVPACEP